MNYTGTELMLWNKNRRFDEVEDVKVRGISGMFL